MSDLIVANVRPWGADPVDIVISGSEITSIRPAGTEPDRADQADRAGQADRSGRSGAAGPERVDGGGLLALPGFVNAHAHVDKSWWGMPWVPYGGEATTQGRIAHERAERDRYGIPSVDATIAVLREFARHGTTTVRSHVDVDLGLGLRGIEVVAEAVAALDGAIEVEIVAFPQDGVIRRPGVLDLLDRAAEQGAGQIGGIDPASIDRDPVAQLDGLFEIAVRRGVGIDIHLHDRAELGAFQIELIVQRTREAGLAGKVNVAHGFAIGQLPPARQEELLDACAEAGVSWSTVAPIGSDPLPWRGMRERGIALGLGTDGIRDLWSPYGDGDLLRIAANFARLHGLRRDEDLTEAVDLAGRRAAGFVHRHQHDLTVGSRADIVLVDAQNVPDALVRVPRRHTVVAGGRILVSNGDLLR